MKAPPGQVWDTPDGWLPFTSVVCACGHEDTRHHWTGKAFTWCTVWSPDKCTCLRFEARP